MSIIPQLKKPLKTKTKTKLWNYEIVEKSPHISTFNCTQFSPLVLQIQRV